MNMEEYTWYAHGAYIRNDSIPEGLRRIWVTLHNAHYKEKIQSFFELNKRWPLYKDSIGKRPQDEAEEKLKMFRELKAQEAAAKDKINQHAERRASDTGQQ